jgi:hypothetical protein
MNYGQIKAGYQTSVALTSYKKLLFDILDEMSEEVLGVDKTEIKNWYDDKFSRSWNLRSIFKAFDKVDISKFPQEIYKRLFFLEL